MRIAVIGAGGIGAIYGAALAKAGAEITFVARGAHLAAMRENGLRIEGDRGETGDSTQPTAQPTGEMADFRHDWIPDDVVLKMAGWQCCFGCCNKHLAHSLEIKA